MSQIFHHFRKDRGEHKKYLSCHHLVLHHITPPNLELNLLAEPWPASASSDTDTEP